MKQNIFTTISLRMKINLRMFKERRKLESEYFETCRERVVDQNYRMARQVLTVILFLYIILLGIAVTILNYLKINTVYYLMFPILFVAYLVFFFARKKELSPLAKGLLAALFYFALFGELILIDDLHDFEATAAWFPGLIVLLPSLLIARMRIYLALEGLLCTIHLLLSYNFKPEVLFRKDAFAAVAAIIISMIGAYIILEGRIAQGLQENELREVTDEAARANQAKSEFLSRVSHEIRTPINAILGINEIIYRDYDEPKLKDYTTSIKRAGKTLLSEINDLLDFSKIEAGKLEIVEVPYDFAEALSEIHSIVETQADQKKLKLIFDIDPTLPRRMYGDVARLQQCSLNLLTNSIKYTDEGSVTFSVKDLEQEGDIHRIRVEIADTGVGISKEDIAKLMIPFERLDEKKYRQVQGTGLGLPIVGKVLDLMQSKLVVDSEIGKGSKFSFIVKQKALSEDEVRDSWTYVYSDSEAENETRQLTAPNAWVLLIDDNEMNLVVAQGLLEKTRIHVDSANSGEAGLAMLEEVKYDMVFIDQRMPGMNGMEVLKRLRALEDNPNAKVPCIALTADAIVGARERYLSAGFDDYLTKPFTMDQLFKQLANHLPPEKIVMDEKGKLIDVEYGKINCGDDATYELVRSKFFDTLDEKADEIEHFFEERDWENYGIKVHALKTSARLVGCKELSEMARELEKAADENNEEKILADTEELLAYYRKLKAEA
ncbi:MAG: response regulator [Lachnospiraceae bacterium]|nr:response regulator [Lachnospiraceae bacterium]